MPESAGVAFSLYVVRCANGSLYTGISTDVSRRLAEHNDGRRGARALRGKGPLQIVFTAEVGSRSRATRLEHRVKQLSKYQKEALVSGRLQLADLDLAGDA